MRTQSVTTRFLIRERCRLSEQWLGWSLAAALTALALGRAADTGLAPWAFPVQLLAMAVAAAFFLHWIRQVRGLDAMALARRVDRRERLEALVESAVELRDVPTPLAVRLREAADEQLGRVPVAGTGRWLAAWCSAAVAAAACMAVFLFPPPEPSAAPALAVRPLAMAAKPDVAPVETPRPVVPPPRIELSWKSPARVERARGYEEIPLLLGVEANRALQSANLEIELNGGGAFSRPISAEIFRVHPAQPAADWPLTLFLDETGAKPYDVAFYFVQASAADGNHAVSATSRRQLIELVPLSTPSRLPEAASAALAQLNAWKLAQAELLATTRDSAPTDETAAVSTAVIQLSPAGRRQQEHEAQAESAVAAARSLGLRAEAILALDALRGEMAAARAALAKGDPGPAAGIQARVVSTIAAAQRAIAAMPIPESDAASPAPKSRPDLADSARQITPAGTLEQLARRQAANNERTQAAADDPAQLRAVAEEQTSIARALERLVARRGLIPRVQLLVERAQEPAAEAARQFSLGDLQAGREPAAETERLLRRAVELQESEAKKAANAVLEQARSSLQTAAKLTDSAAQSAHLQQLMRELNDEIERQKQQGSTEAAQRLKALADQLEKAERKKTPSDQNEPAQENSAAEPGGEESEKNEGSEFVAYLRGRDEPETARPSGTAELTVKTDTGEATIAVRFERTPSAISEQRLVVVAAGGPSITVAKPPRRAFGRQRVRWDGGSALSVAQIMQALAQGRLAIEVATARVPAGELVGRFVGTNSGFGEAGDQRGLGVGSGSKGGPGAQRSTAMPTVNPDGSPFRDVLLRLSTAAAESQAALAPDETLSQTIRQLKAAAAQLAAAEMDPAAHARLQLAVEKAQVLAAAAPQSELTASASAAAAGAATADATAIRALLERAAQLAVELEDAQVATPREDWLRRFPPEQIDPAYRRPIEDYFEMLSREAMER